MKSLKSLAAFAFFAQAAFASSNPCAEVEGSEAEYKNGTKTLSGCRLKVVEPESLFGRLGLKPGDLVQPARPSSGVTGLQLQLENTLQSSNKEKSPESAKAEPRDSDRESAD